uniref:Uncharacterized protein n=1 Tax=Rhizophora mucronata TaxID=61149 RepID=A0A2P2MXJ5_RHIMU
MLFVKLFRSAFSLLIVAPSTRQQEKPTLCYRLNSRIANLKPYNLKFSWRSCN